MGEPLHEVMESQPVPLLLSNPEKLKHLLPEWIANGFPVSDLCRIFDPGWIAQIYTDWLLAWGRWYAGNYFKLPLRLWVDARPFFRAMAPVQPHWQVEFYKSLPFETYGRRALTELGQRMAVLDAVSRYVEKHPELKGKQDAPVQDWLVSIHTLRTDEEKTLFGWQDGDTWRDLIQRRIAFLETYGAREQGSREEMPG